MKFMERTILICERVYSKNKLLGIDSILIKKKKNVYPVKIVRKGEINYNFSIYYRSEDNND